MRVERQLERIVRRLERSLERLNEEDGFRRPFSWKRHLLLNFTGGLARGAGTAVGLAALGAAAAALLRRLMSVNTPVIGGYLAEVIRVVLNKL